MVRNGNLEPLASVDDPPTSEVVPTPVDPDTDAGVATTRPFWIVWIGEAAAADVWSPAPLFGASEPKQMAQIVRVSNHFETGTNPIRSFFVKSN